MIPINVDPTRVSIALVGGGEAARLAKKIDASGPTLVVIGDVVDLHHALGPLRQAEPAVAIKKPAANQSPPPAEGRLS
jgi:hypothetical protein